ncbi:hypothetical protein [Rhodococcoides corynebacterioides]|uniref:hypothetical protein n=1 Tax=Rhodococcoides corynebacterioides TaxID=53972 RepID=UPI0008362775|nr:hypothetical protein [Rhodococcus corynebacterioides]
MADEQLIVTWEAAKHCASALGRFAEDLQTIASDVQRNGRVSGFGTLPSGIALNAKYTELTSGGSGSLTAMLQGHIDIATKLADTFRRMGEQYMTTDDAVAASLRPTEPR